MAVGVLARITEETGEPRRDLVRNDVLYRFSLCVESVDRNPEGSMQERFDEPVTPKHLRREIATPLGELDAIRSSHRVLHQLMSFEGAPRFRDRRARYG